MADNSSHEGEIPGEAISKPVMVSLMKVKGEDAPESMVIENSYLAEKKPDQEIVDEINPYP